MGMALPASALYWNAKAGAEEMEHRAYRPVLSTGQAGMPTLPKACRYLAVVT